MRGVVAEVQGVDPVGLGGLGGLGGAAREQSLLVRRERGLGVVRVRGEDLAEFGAVVLGEIGSLARRGHQVGGVAEQRHAGHACPTVSVRQGVDGVKDRGGLAVRDQGGEFRGPVVPSRALPAGRRPEPASEGGA